jgi:antitoxin component of MazEF toxin-antitoxin module
MKRQLVRTGNSVALVLTKDMREHLGVSDSVDVQFVEGQIVLRKPLSLEEASDRSDKKFSEAYKRLAK